MSFAVRLRAAVADRGSLLCVGLDPDLERLPAGLPRSPEGMLRFNREIIAATGEAVCAYKPNLAFYEAHGAAGYDLLRRTLEAVPRGVITIGDGKRGDVDNTARMYAKALFEALGFDAATVSPYLGRDALQPFLADPERGAFILCRTSNPGAADLQERIVGCGEGARPLYEVVACQARGWDARGNVGLVVGATAPEQLARVRELAPDLPLLVPGVGAQDGDLAAAAGASRPAAPAIVSASRSILYASSGTDFARAAGRAARELRDAINARRQDRA